MKKLFVFALSALAVAGLASCNGEQASQVSPTDEFDQNTEEIKPDIHMFIVGSHWNNWTPEYDNISAANPSCEFVLDGSSSGLNTKYTYTAVVTQEMAESWCGFKFVATQGWGAQWGMEDVDFVKSNAAFLNMIGDLTQDEKVDNDDKHTFKGGTSNRSNIVVTLPGTYVIEYYPYNFASETVNEIPYSCKFAIQFTPAA